MCDSVQCPYPLCDSCKKDLATADYNRGFNDGRRHALRLILDWNEDQTPIGKKPNEAQQALKEHLKRLLAS